MKKFILLLLFTANAVSLAFGQTPETFSYQAVLRNADGTAIANQEVSVDVEILQGSATGTSVFSETHSLTTSPQGIITLTIGSVESLSGIEWGASTYFIKISVNGNEIGTSQLLSVPFALHAKTAENITEELNESDPVFTAWDKSTGIEVTESQISDLQNYLTAESDPAVTSNFDFAGAATGDLLQFNGTKWVKVTPGYLTSYTEIDPIFTAWDKTTGISITESQISDLQNYLTDESDPAVSTNFDFIGATNGDLLQFNGTKWVKVTPGYLTSYTETDPTFTAWDKTTGINITESQISDLQSYLTAESDPAVSTNFDFTGAATDDLLQFNGTKWVKVTPDYLTAETDPAVTSNFDFIGAANGDLLQFNGTKWVKVTPGYLTSYTETDPIWIADSTNYFTKLRLQTSGKAEVHYNNITNTPTTLFGYGITDGFQNGGESSGSDRTLGNIDNYSLGLKTNNATRLLITSDGNVGIGKTPSYMVDVNGSLNAAEIRVNGSVLSPGSGSNWTVTGSDIYRIGGNIGIGTSSINPSAKLHVKSSNPVMLQLDLSDNTLYNQMMLTENGGQRAAIIQTGSMAASNPNYLAFVSDGREVGGKSGFSFNIFKFSASNPGEVMRITNDGYVGIGTTTPSGLLSLGSGEGGSYERKLLLFESGNSKSGLGSISGETRMFIPSDQHLSYGTLSTVDGVTWTEKIRMSADGNLGIGTISPSSQLHIVVPDNENNNPFDNGIYVFNNGSADDNDDAIISLRTNGDNSGDPFISFDIYGVFGWTAGIDNSDENKFKISRDASDINANTRFTIEEDGDIGVGTTTPEARFEVKKAGWDDPLILLNSDNAGIGSGSSIHWKNNGAGYFSSIAGLDDGEADGRIEFRVSNDGAITNSPLTAANTVMLINQNGNVGIGITDPGTKKLSVLGDVQVHAPVWNSGDEARLYLGPDNNVWIAHKRELGLALQTAPGYSTIFRDGAEENVRITGSGNVGIGTTTPTGKLHIAGAFSENSVYQDGSDRPSVGMTGVYPQLVMMSGSYSNPNHGSTIMLGSYDDGSTSGNHKHWSIGTAGSGSTFLDIGYHAGTDLNPHAGIRNYNGTTFFTILNSGNVGIGTTDPGELLDLSRSVGSAVVRIHRPGTAEYKIGIGTDENVLRIVNSNGGNPITSYTGGIMITPAGNVGIGTATPAGKLQIAGSFSENSIYQDGNDRPSLGITGNFPHLVLMSGNNGNTTHGPAIMLGSFDDGSSSGTHKHWSIGTSGINSTFLDIGYSASTINPHAGIRNAEGTTFFTILNSGNVGIGKLDPTEKLELGGTSSNFYLNSATSNMILFNNSGVAAPTFTTRSTGTKIVLYPNISESLSDYALGIDNSTMWLSVPNSSSQFKFYAGTTELMKISGDGNVGIGTTSPVNKLEVNIGTNWQDGIQVTGNSTWGPFVRLRNSILDGADWYILSGGGYDANSPTGSLSFHQGGIGTRLTINSNGNLGISTTSPSGLLSLGSGEGGAHERKLILFESGNSKSGLGSVSGETRMFIPSDQHLSFGTLSTTDGSTWTERMRLTNDGLLGIGTTNPEFPLDVNGQIHSKAGVSDNSFTRIPSDNEVAYSTSDGGGAQSAWIWRERWGGANFGIFHNNSTDYIHVVGSSIARMSIDLGTGNVGIGTTIPSRRFTVYNNSGENVALFQQSEGIWAAARLTLSSGDGASDNYAYSLRVGGTGRGDDGNSAFQIVNENLGTTPFVIRSTGNVGFGTTDPTKKLDVADNGIRIRNSSSPASNADGYTGEIRWDADYIYICTSGDGPGGAADTWKRAQLTTW